MALGLDFHTLDNCVYERCIIIRMGAQNRHQFDFVILAQAQIELAFACDSNAVTRFAKVVAVRRDKSYFGISVWNLPVASRAPSTKRTTDERLMFLKCG